MTSLHTLFCKKCLFLSFFLCFSAFLSAKTFTVSNNPETPGQFGDMPSAINSALVANGDTLLIQGSPINYGNFNVTKALTLIGPGHHPQKQNPLTATVNLVYLYTDNIQIYGLVVTDRIWAFQGRRTNITIAYCRANLIDSYNYGGSNWIIRNNIVATINNEIASATLMSNNIVTGYILGCGGSTSIKNNLFIGTGSTNYAINNAPTGGIVANNIFYNTSLSINGTYSGTVYQNNLSYLLNGTLNFPRGNGNILERNLENVNPLFVNVPANATTFSYDHNYRVQATSPARNAGNDGTDIGVYGLATFSMTGELPQQPVIRTMTILNPTVPSGGALRVSATISRAVSGN